MKKVVIISHEPLTINLKKLFFIEEFLDFGLTVEYWDISSIVRNGIKLVDQVEGDYIKKILDLVQFQNQLEKQDISNTIFIVELSSIWENRFFYKLLSDFKCQTWGIDQYANTSLVQTKKDYLLKLLDVKNLYSKLKYKYWHRKLQQFNKQYNVKKMDRFFTSSSFDYRVTDFINHPDFEAFKSVSIKNEREPFILFIDNYFPLHPDFEFFYKKKLTGAKEYQESLCNFFDFLEEKYAMPVIIGAHPKADYEPSTFKGREIIKYKTIELIKESSFVLMHASNSISTVLLTDKPLLMITTTGYDKVSFLALRIRQLARILGLPVLNIDRDNYNNLDFTKVESKIRKNYIYSYLTKEGIEDKRTIDIILESIKKS